MAVGGHRAAACGGEAVPAATGPGGGVATRCEHQCRSAGSVRAGARREVA